MFSSSSSTMKCVKALTLSAMMSFIGVASISDSNSVIDAVSADNSISTTSVTNSIVNTVDISKLGEKSILKCSPVELSVAHLSVGHILCGIFDSDSGALIKVSTPIKIDVVVSIAGVVDVNAKVQLSGLIDIVTGYATIDIPCGKAYKIGQVLKINASVSIKLLAPLLNINLEANVCNLSIVAALNVDINTSSLIISPYSCTLPVSSKAVIDVDLSHLLTTADVEVTLYAVAAVDVNGHLQLNAREYAKQICKKGDNYKCSFIYVAVALDVKLYAQVTINGQIIKSNDAPIICK